MRKTSSTRVGGIGINLVMPKTGTSADFDLPRRAHGSADNDDEPPRRTPPPPGMGKHVDKTV